MLKVEEIELASLKPWEDNPRVNDHAVEAVAKSIEMFGFNVPILCGIDYTIIAGHTRWKAAKRLSLSHVPVIIVNMNEKDRKAFSIADNKTAEISDWNYHKPREILEELRLEDVDLSCMGFTNEDMRRLMGMNDVNENDVPETSESVITKPGDMWIMGGHKLVCGDSKNIETVEFLSEGQKTDHIFGGPPYFNQRDYARWNNLGDYLSDMRNITDNCYKILRDGGVIVWNIANECSSHLDLTGRHSSILSDSGFQYLDTIIWVKKGANYAIPRNFHIRRNGCYYPAFQWEALLVFQKPGDMPKMTREGIEYMCCFHTNVWDIPAVTNQLEKYGHPAVCPVEIPYRSIQAYTGENAVIFEPFGGSGTTLIAAEKAGRKAILVEQHPKYCDIIVKRWERLTGRKATLIKAQD